MGLLSNLGGALKKAATAVVKSPVGKALDVLTVAVAHPVQTIKAVVSPKTTVKEVVTQHFAQPVKEQIKDTVLGGAGIAATVLGGAAIGTAAKAGTLLPAIIPTTLKGKVIAAVAAPIVIGAVAKEPLGALKAVASAPSELGQFGGDLASFAADPSISAAKQIVTESPILSAAVAAVGAGAIIKAAAPIIGGALQKEAIEEQTEAIREAGGKVAPTTTAPTTTAPTTTAPTAPTLPQTERLVTTAPKTSGKRKKRSSKAPVQNISQRVNVVVANKSTSTGLRQTHKYLNRELLISR